MTKLIVLDFDGTILDTRNFAVRAFVRALDKLGIKYSEKDFGLLGMKMGEILKELGVSDSLFVKAEELFFRYFKDEALSGEIRACGDLDVLWDLKEDFEMVVVSNNRKEFLELLIEKMGLSGLFSEVYGADDDGRSKDEIILDLIKRRGLKKKEVVFVGDRFSDVRYAKKAGVRSVGISNFCSWSSREELEAEKPDYLISDFGELKDIVY